jgi:hypothetical protein
MLLCVAGKHLERGEPVLAHHHGLKLVEVHGPAPVLVHLLNDVLEIVLGESAVNLPQDLLQHLNHKGSMQHLALLFEIEHFRFTEFYEKVVLNKRKYKIRS